MPQDKQPPKELKVTDKRIFTAEGDIREEFRSDIHPAVPDSAGSARQEEAAPTASTAPPDASAPAASAPGSAGKRRPEEERRRTMADRASNPATPFTNFIEPLIAQAYMLLGMLRNPYQPQAQLDPVAARQMIEILTLLREKTAGNLTPEEEDFLQTHLGELKLAFVQRTKTI